MSLLLPPARLADILPDDPGQGMAALPDYASLMPGVDARRRSRCRWPISTTAVAVCSRAIGGGLERLGGDARARSAAGGSLLANDPHLGLTAPTIWYLARLQLPTGGVIGGTIPGMPLVLVGRSEQLGWGLTTAYLDDQDVVIEQLNPANPEEYLTPDGPKPLRQPPDRSSRSRMRTR